MITLDYTLDLPARTVTVCAWCNPGGSILTKYPHLASIHRLGVWDVQHTICERHRKECEAQAARVRPILYPAHTQTETA